MGRTRKAALSPSWWILRQIEKVSPASKMSCGFSPLRAAWRCLGPLGAGGVFGWLHWHMNRFWDFASGLPRPGVSPKLCPCGKAVVVVLEKVAGAGMKMEDGTVGSALHWDKDRAESPKAELWEGLTLRALGIPCGFWSFVLSLISLLFISSLETALASTLHGNLPCFPWFHWAELPWCSRTISESQAVGLLLQLGHCGSCAEG